MKTLHSEIALLEEVGSFSSASANANNGNNNFPIAAPAPGAIPSSDDVTVCDFQTEDLDHRDSRREYEMSSISFSGYSLPSLIQYGISNRLQMFTIRMGQ